MSYHYRQGNKAEEIRRQLNELQMGIESDHKSLDRLKLEADVSQMLFSSTKTKENLSPMIKCPSLMKS